MKRCWFGLGLLIFLLIGGLVVTGCMTGNHGEVARDLDRAALAAEESRWEEAGAALRQAQSRWQKKWAMSAAFADHGPMEEIDGLFAQAQIYLRSQNPEAMAAICAQLSRLVEAVGEAHALTWSNLL